ncbi:hypothetical protein [Pedobacter insulae]|uniref:Transglutaminase-like superfamily protein n=1 Tax=Pedobacter insulae TaxID=414048 RepID=A0A1I2Y2T5_9SPHI|nr:hypothetical protein [Pedobacter insulae]SFH18641.1 hypothetical protein SAMN04489864_106128 [Pedobacter insulae]
MINLKRSILYFILMLIGLTFSNRVYGQNYSFEIYGNTFNLKVENSFLLENLESISTQSINVAYNRLNESHYQPIIDTLLAYQKDKNLNDWLFYQLIRRTAEEISPKKQSYERYTIYKWFLLGKSGYDARLTVVDDRIVMYIYNDENISDIPSIVIGKKKYMCLNYHDYAHTNFTSLPEVEVLSISNASKSFSYRITQMPDFNPKSYKEKKITFRYKMQDYHFDIKLNSEVEAIFKNYPGVDFSYSFNIPLTKETYSSLIPILKINISKMSQKKGIDYLMRFTRYAFLYEDDSNNFGKEKRLSPEQTLLNQYSDCDDRAALFFYLVKEIYNLPMIVLLYPTHVTMAVQLDKTKGNRINYNGKSYTFCEPTPQLKDLRIGQLSPKFKKEHYEIVYAYDPIK